MKPKYLVASAIVILSMVPIGISQITHVNADEIQQTRTFEYVPSKLGVDYYALAPSPLAEMLSQGEVEWMENAKPDYLEDTAEVWEDEILPKVAKGEVSMIIIENLRDYTPNMLSLFAVGLHPKDKKYSGLWSVGTNHVARKLAGKS